MTDLSTILISGSEIQYKYDGVEPHSSKYIKSAIVSRIYDPGEDTYTRIILNNNDTIDPLRHMICISKYKIPLSDELIVNPRQKWMRLIQFKLVPDEIEMTPPSQPHKAKRIRVSRGLANYDIQNQRYMMFQNQTKLDELHPAKIYLPGITPSQTRSVMESINHYYERCVNLGLIEKFYKSKITSSSSFEEFKKRREALKQKVTRAKKKDAFDLNIQTSVKFYRRAKEVITKRQVKVREAMYMFEYNNKCQRIKICPSCKENVMINPRNKTELNEYFTPTSVMHASCKKCKEDDNVKADSNYYENTNRHPVWYKHDISTGEMILGPDGKPIVQYNIPDELKDLRLGEKLLIQRFSPYIPTQHIKNGTYGIKGHCVTFPQDITLICNELPQRKEKLLTFIRYMSNKDNTSTYPKQYVIRRQKVVTALKWLKVHHTGYRDIIIQESNLEWMGTSAEKNMAEIAQTVTTKQATNDDEEEFVSKAHKVNEANDDIVMTTMHNNKKKSLPSKEEARPIIELIKQKEELNKINEALTFPPIDVSQPTS